jgi:tetratricopeptide (TPR) repeat protein
MDAEVLTVQQLISEAQAAYHRGDYLEAARLFEHASQQYTHSGDELAAAEMANNQSVALLQSGNAQAALAAVGDTASLFAARGDIRRQAMALGNQAAALDALNRLPEALAAYQQSADLLHQIGETDLRAYVMQSISKIQFRTGRQMEALATMQVGVEGIQHPTLKQRFLKRLLRIPMRWMGIRS